jgi:hypothetical protein
VKVFSRFPTCTFNYWYRRQTPEVQAQITESLLPGQTIPTALSTPPNLLTKQEAKFIQFLLCGFDETSNTSSNDSANQRLTNFISTCMQDPTFTRLAEKASEHYTQTVLPKVTEPSHIPWLTKVMAVFQIFLVKDTPTLAVFADFLRIHRNDDVQSGCATYSDYAMGKSNFMNGTVFALDTALARFTMESPNFGIALKAKIQQHLTTYPAVREAFTTWQAQLPKAARP